MNCAYLVPLLGLAVFAAGAARANPTGGVVTAGTVSIVQVSPTLTRITETSTKAIVDWPSFSIAPGSTVDIVQPTASAILFNRVLSGPLSIGGVLTANGQVWFSAPAGVAVAPGARIAAAGLILTTADLTDGDFFAGNYSFGIPGTAGARVVNQGTIIVTGSGAAVLAGAAVENDGIVEADLGTVALGGFKTFAVDFNGDGLLKFAVTTAGSPALVSNSGTLTAPGGKVLLTAVAVKGIVDNVINSTGIIEATRAANIDGQIVLSASGGGIELAGTVKASGGLSVTADSITVAAGTHLGAGSITLSTGGSITISGDAVPPVGAITTGGSITTEGAFLEADGSGGGGPIVVAVGGGEASLSFAPPPRPQPPAPPALAALMIATKSLPLDLGPTFKPPPLLDMSELSPPGDPIAPPR